MPEATRFGGGIEAILAAAEHPAELGTNDSQTLHGGRLRTMLRRAIERAHIDGRGVSFHTLRHSIASRLVAANVDIKTVSTILGHSTSRMLLERYAHESEARKRAAISAHTGAVGHILGSPAGKSSACGVRPRRRLKKSWWTAGGSNSRPPRCERGALPAELAAHCSAFAKLRRDESASGQASARQAGVDAESG